MTVIDNWTLRYEEVSNNVFEVELLDNLGRRVVTTDHNLKEAVKTCISYAFDIERKLKNSLNKFLYDTFKYFLLSQKFIVDRYDDQIFGSWIIEDKNVRLLLDGKESLLVLQTQGTEKVWSGAVVVSLKDLTIEMVDTLSDRLFWSNKALLPTLYTHNACFLASAEATQVNQI
jgi:hypothetical protein